MTNRKTTVNLPDSSAPASDDQDCSTRRTEASHRKPEPLLTWRSFITSSAFRLPQGSALRIGTP